MDSGAVKAIIVAGALVFTVGVGAWGLHALGKRLDRSGLVAQAELLAETAGERTDNLLRLKDANQRLAVENEKLKVRLAAVEAAVSEEINELELKECVATPEFLRSLSRLTDAQR